MIHKLRFASVFKPQLSFNTICVAGLIVVLWGRVFMGLSGEWNDNPQYSYGWVVPLLCMGMIYLRWHSIGGTPLAGQTHTIAWMTNKKGAVALFCLGFVYMPIRLLEEANPEWRAMNWALVIEVISITIISIYWLGGALAVRKYAFPILFFLVAVPWPSPVESRIIRALTEASSMITVEVVGLCGFPAIQHGNVIEVGTGVVGIDEACSGIRSFQSSLMMSLFLGELYRLTLFRRCILIPCGFLLSFGFNICRTSLLTIIAAKKGVSAIKEYHDPAGLAILVACTIGLWGLATLLRKKRSKSDTVSEKSSVTDNAEQDGAVTQTQIALKSPANFSPSGFYLAVKLLLVWIVITEIGVPAWYSYIESKQVETVRWSIVWPTAKQDFSTKTISILKADTANQVSWHESSDNSRWSLNYLEWLPGKRAGYLAKRHTPEACLPATGMKMISVSPLTWLTIHGVQFPFMVYEFDTGAGALYVYYCRWEDGAKPESYRAERVSLSGIIRGVWAGRGNAGQKVIELAAHGNYDNADKAKDAAVRQLEQLIKIESRK